MNIHRNQRFIAGLGLGTNEHGVPATWPPCLRWEAQRVKQVLSSYAFLSQSDLEKLRDPLRDGPRKLYELAARFDEDGLSRLLGDAAATRAEGVVDTLSRRAERWARCPTKARRYECELRRRRGGASPSSGGTSEATSPRPSEPPTYAPT